MDTDRAERLQRAFLGMKRQEAMDAAALAIQSGDDPLVILKTCREAMEAVGKRFETGEFFLSELIYSAEVFRAVSAMLEPVLRIPASGDCGYCGLIKDPDGRVCIAYYSQHAYKLGVLPRREPTPDMEHPGRESDIFVAHIQLP